MTSTGARPRVLHVITSYPPEFSGHGRQLRSLIPYLASLGIQNSILTSRVAPGTAVETIDGAEVCRLPRTPGRLGYLSFAARACWWAACRRRDFDIIHYQGADWPGAVGGPILRLLGKKTIVTLTLLGVDDPLSLRAARAGWLEEMLLKRVERVIAISSSLAAAAREAGWRADSIREIPIGVDTARFSPPTADGRLDARRQLASRFEFDPRGPLVAFVGAVIRRKGIDVLMSAWPAVAAAVPGATLLVVGPTGVTADNHEFSPAFVAAVAGGARPRSVILTGPMDDTAPVYRASDVFVLPSRREGLPNVLLEACASGLACVISDLPGVAAEVVEDGVSGLVVAQEDPAALSAAVVRVLTTPELRAALGARARAVAAERYALERVAAATAREYRALIAGSSSLHE